MNRLRRLARRSRQATTETAEAARFWARLRATPNDPILAGRLAGRMKEVTPND